MSAPLEAPPVGGKEAGMKQITVRVTEDHIAEGTLADPECCPIALALESAGMDLASVNEYQASFDCEGKFYLVGLPRRASRFVRDYDRLRPVKPFAFRLRLDR